MANDQQLTDKQRQRIAYAEEYERDTASDREARNAALSQIDAKFEEKWLALQGQIELKRGELLEKYRAEGLSEAQIRSLLATEAASVLEKHYAERDAEMRKADLATPKTWLEWLQEKRKRLDDPVLDELIEEANRNDQPALDGYLRNPPPSIVIPELTPRPGSDGQTVDYTRGMLVVVSDKGARLDVRRTDDRDIEAALKIAAQKFDPDQGVLLTGDLAFKRRAAEIAGRLGLKIRNAEPEVLLAYRKGEKSRPEPVKAKARAQDVANGVEGDPVDRFVSKMNEPLPLIADSYSLDAVSKGAVPGVHAEGEAIVMDGDLAARAASVLNLVPSQSLPVFAKIDIAAPDGGLTDAERESLKSVGIFEGGKLTNEAAAAVLLRDAHIMQVRSSMTKEQIDMFSAVYRTAYELRNGDSEELRRDKEKASELEQKREQEQEQKQDKQQEIEMNLPPPAFLLKRNREVELAR